MAKKLTEKMGGPEQEPTPVADPVLADMAAARKQPANSTPIYYQRGIPGRDGTGEWIVKEHGAVMMPNGDYAKPGDTFNQRDEGFNDAQMHHLASKWITQNKVREVRPGLITKPAKAEVTKGGSGEGGGSDPASC